MKKIICLLISLLCVAVIMSACGESQTEAEPTSPATPDSVSDVGLMSVTTDYCILKYPDKWGKSLDVKIDDKDIYTVAFTYEGTPVFDLTFNGGDGEPLGTIKTKDGTAVIRLDVQKLDPKDENYDVYRVMQEDINTIVDNLKNDYEFVSEVSEDSSDDVFEIKTSFVSLYYPQKWEDKVQVSVSDDSVAFSYANTALFDIYFGTAEGEAIGTYNNTRVYLNDHLIDEKSLTPEQYSTAVSMKEDINVLLQHLFKESGFTVD